MCSLFINGTAHGGIAGTTTCQLHMRHFKDGDEITIEPWRAKPFPVLKDLIVDRTAPDANAMPIPKKEADLAMDAASCIGRAACVAACPNASAMLFVSDKIS